MVKPPKPTGDPKEGAIDDDSVITPAGPAKRKNVHVVGPDEVVRRMPDGTYKVSPKE